MNNSVTLDYATFNLILDIVLVVLGLLMAYAATTIPAVGAIGKTVRLVATGAIILGFAHLAETFLHESDISVELNELIHRGIIFIGFAFLYVGLKKLADSLSSMRSKRAGSSA